MCPPGPGLVYGGRHGVKRPRVGPVRTRGADAGEDGVMTLNIAVIPGDGIGKEIVPEGLKVLDRVLADKGIDYSTTSTWVPSAGTPPATPSPTRTLRPLSATMSSSWVQSATPPFPLVSSSAGCSSSYVSLSTTT